MGKYTLSLRCIIAGALLTCLGVFMILAFWSSKDLQDIRNMGFIFVLAGPAAMTLGVVLWPRSKMERGDQAAKSSVADSEQNQNPTNLEGERGL